MPETLITKLLEIFAGQGPYALVLAALAYVFAKYWILPKAEADLDRVNEDMVFNKERMELARKVEKSIDEIHVSMGAEKKLIINSISLFGDAINAILSKDEEKCKGVLASLSSILKNEDK